MTTSTGVESSIRAESDEQPAAAALPSEPAQPSEERDQDGREIDAEETEIAETEDEEEIEAGASDAAPATVDAAQANPTAGVANPSAGQPEAEDRRSALEKQAYEFEQCTVQIAIQLLPNDGHANGRPALIGVRTHLDAPILRMLRANELGELPPAITALVEQLRSELPDREQAARDRIEKEKMERLQRQLKAKAVRGKGIKPVKARTVQTAAAPAASALTVGERANAVSSVTANDREQLAMF